MPLSALDFTGMKKTYRTRGCDYIQRLISRGPDPSRAVAVSPAPTRASPQGGMCPQGTAEFGLGKQSCSPPAYLPKHQVSKRTIIQQCLANRRKKIS